MYNNLTHQLDVTLSLENVRHVKLYKQLQPGYQQPVDEGSYLHWLPALLSFVTLVEVNEIDNRHTCHRACQQGVEHSPVLPAMSVYE